MMRTVLCQPESQKKLPNAVLPYKTGPPVWSKRVASQEKTKIKGSIKKNPTRIINGAKLPTAPTRTAGSANIPDPIIPLIGNKEAPIGPTLR